MSHLYSRWGAGQCFLVCSGLSEQYNLTVYIYFKQWRESIQPSNHDLLWIIIILIAPLACIKHKIYCVHPQAISLPLSLYIFVFSGLHFLHCLCFCILFTWGQVRALYSGLSVVCSLNKLQTHEFSLPESSASNVPFVPGVHHFCYELCQFYHNLESQKALRQPSDVWLKLYCRQLNQCVCLCTSEKQRERQTKKENTAKPVKDVYNPSIQCYLTIPPAPHHSSFSGA